MAAARENLDNGLIITIGILFVVLTFVLILLVQGWFYKAQTDEHRRKVIEPRAEELASTVAEQQQLLHSYGVVDTEKGTVAIPIERAMELVVREGL
jgi:sensor histidine kinase regulating citrate/malate metabolism